MRFCIKKNYCESLPNADRYTDCLVRLPLFYEVDEKKVIEIMVNY